MVRASHWVGFTLPGIIDDPGSFSGKFNSPSPDLGPDPSNLISLAILWSETATVFIIPDISTIASCVAIASNLFSAVLKLIPVNLDTLEANNFEKLFFVFKPVPTAVPPWAKYFSLISANSTRLIPNSICFWKPENSWPKERGVASCKWVLPILMILSHNFTFLDNSLCKYFKEGMTDFVTVSTQAICIAVGKVSFEDWLLLQWSFGWTGDFDPKMPPKIWIALFEITSLAFIFVCVPEPVCHITNGKCSFNFPSATSFEACIIALPIFLSIIPSSKFVFAEQNFIIPNALTKMSGIVSFPILKFFKERWVCAPQSILSKTFIDPKLSFSSLKFIL